VNGEQMCILVIHEPKRWALQLTGCRSDGMELRARGGLLVVAYSISVRTDDALLILQQMDRGS
jgi:hypothetical protein